MIIMIIMIINLPFGGGKQVPAIKMLILGRLDGEFCESPRKSRHRIEKRWNINLPELY